MVRVVEQNGQVWLRIRGNKVSGSLWDPDVSGIRRRLMRSSAERMDPMLLGPDARRRAAVPSRLFRQGPPNLATNIASFSTRH